MSYSFALGAMEQTWRGPQRLVLTVDHERVTDCDYRGDDDGSGTPMARLPLAEALELAGRACDTCAHAHRLAFCQAVESLAGVEVHERAAAIRTLAAELERAASHVDTSRQVMHMLALPAQASALLGFQQQLREGIAVLHNGSGLAGLCVPGGVAHDLEEQAQTKLIEMLRGLNQQLYRLIDTLIDRRSLLGATADVGVLLQDAAASFGVRGPLARASGIRSDTRLDAPYAFYPHIDCHLIVQEGGDVYARLVVLFLEAFESLKIAEQVLADLPSGPWRGSSIETLPPGVGSAAVEAPRGKLVYSLESDGRRLSSVQVDAPRQIDRLMARTLLLGASLDDVPLILLSFDVCPACSEL